MTHIVDTVAVFDKKRMKVTLDYGNVTFLLYKGEMRQAGISASDPPAELTDEDYQKILTDILIPRAKKRCLYYLKNGDKTEFQIKRKLAEGFYPPEAAEAALEFLRHYSFADDRRYSENFSEELKGSRSKREIEAKLLSKGVDRDTIRETLLSITPGDEYEACKKALKKNYTGDNSKDFRYLLRKGFPYDMCEQAVREYVEN